MILSGGGAQFVLDVAVANPDAGVDTGVAGGLEGFGSNVNVVHDGAGESADDDILDDFTNLGDGAKIARAGDGEAGL